MTHLENGSWTTLTTELADGVLTVTLHRPDRANALNEHMMRELRELWKSTAADRSLRCIILTGEGRFFCAGADTSMLAGERTTVGADSTEELSFLPGGNVDVPVIVAVNGTCAGGGLHFVTDADIVVASEAATFIDPHVSVGQVSGIEPIELLSSMRKDRVIRMALLGTHEKLSATDALDAGLVSEVVPHEQLLDRARALAAQIVTGSPEAIRQTRRVYRSYLEHLQREHLDLGWQAVQDHWSHPDSTEGPTAFNEKRAPRWAEQ